MSARTTHVAQHLLRMLALSAMALWTVVGHAQGKDPALREEIRSTTDLIRSGPPGVALHRTDSLLTLERYRNDGEWMIHLHALRGHALRQLGRSDEALAAYIRSYKLAEQAADHEAMVDAQLSIAAVHLDLRDFARAGHELRHALRTSEQYRTSHAARIQLVLGARASMMHRSDSALHWYGRALTLAEAARDSFMLADLHYNMGVVYDQLDSARLAEKHLSEGLRHIPRVGYSLLEGTTQEIRAHLRIRSGRYREAITLLDSAEAIARRLSHGELLIAVIEDRAEIHEATGATDLAMATLKELIEVKDSVAHVVRDEAFAAAQTRLDMSRLEKELELSKAEAELGVLRAQRARIAWGALIIIAVLAIGLIILFHRQARAEQRAALALEQDKERLLEENELLHQENLMARFETLKSQVDPHFLFNAMNTLYTLVETEPTKARNFIASFSALYRQVLLSRERTIVPVQEELQLAKHYLFLQRIRFGDSLVVEIDLPQEATNGYLPPFTMQMLLENAIKHNVISANRPLHIQITGDRTRLVVRNDLRPRGDGSRGTGTGLDNIRRRYAMLGAEEPEFRMTERSYLATVPILNEQP